MTAISAAASNNGGNTSSVRREHFELRAIGLRKSFGGVEVLHGVDLNVTGGTVLAVLGENGAGKSTAIKIISGVYVPDEGRIEIDGREVRILTPRDGQANGIRVIYQEMMNAPTLSVYENIFLGNLPNRNGLVRWADARETHRADSVRFGCQHQPEEPDAGAERGRAPGH